MIEGLSQSIASSTGVVLLTEAKAHMGILDTANDATITDKIDEATAGVEEYLQRRLITLQTTYKLDSWPEGNVAVALPLPPLQSVDSITYTDTDGASQTWDASLWIYEADRMIGILQPAYGESYPALRTDKESFAVTITMTCGYGIASAVPNPIKAAIKMYVADLFENREAHSRDRLERNANAIALLSPHRVFAVVA